MNKVRFSLRDMAGNTGFSPIYNVTIKNPPTPDFDDDNDADQEDFGLLQTCIGVDLLSAPECEYADLTLDNLVDQDDVSDFLDCMNGPNQSMPPECNDF